MEINFEFLVKWGYLLVVLLRSELEPALFITAGNNLEEDMNADTYWPSLLPSILHIKVCLFYSGSGVSSLFSSTSLSLVGRDYHLPSAVYHNWVHPYEASAQLHYGVLISSINSGSLANASQYQSETPHSTGNSNSLDFW